MDLKPFQSWLSALCVVPWLENCLWSPTVNLAFSFLFHLFSFLPIFFSVTVVFVDLSVVALVVVPAYSSCMSPLALFDDAFDIFVVPGIHHSTVNVLSVIFIVTTGFVVNVIVVDVVARFVNEVSVIVLHCCRRDWRFNFIIRNDLSCILFGLFPSSIWSWWLLWSTFWSSILMLYSLFGAFLGHEIVFLSWKWSILCYILYLCHPASVLFN